MAYDRMDWHYRTEDFPKELKKEASGTHIGYFLAWAINNDLAGELHANESQESISNVKSRQMTGTEFLQKECDEKFLEEDLNSIGNEFAKYYYESNIYFRDYESALAGDLPTLYHVEDSWENYDRLAKLIGKQFIKWRSAKTKKWWQFWR